MSAMRLSFRSVIFCVAAAALLALPAAAQSKDAKAKEGVKADILGAWSFQTKPYREGECVMTGTMRLSAHKTKGLYACELTAIEMCSFWGRSVVRQSCSARRMGDQVSIRSEIVEMVEQKNEGLTYWPDNFSLTVQSSSRMYGALISAATAPAEFRRTKDGIS
jgi:hypothetical protein